MQSRQLEYLRQRMLEERHQMLERIRSINKGGLGESMDTSFGELSAIDNHPGDVGSEMFERSKDLSLKEQARVVVQAIDNALEAMKQGIYGKCEVCGKEIPLERLEAVPYTTICRDCKAADENIPLRHPRPIEEDVLMHPFERTLNDNTDKNFYDGEDALQEVARHSLSYETDPEYEVDSIDPEGDQREVKGAVEEVENLPYEVDNGIIYESFKTTDEFGPVLKEEEND
ncbi:MAG: TraR/DksA C4-type zinc finger protein [Desulfotomaculum sp.]|nr:TraR/DksA C4-type zinc finger protein [Desulfotomaculum sp.]